MNLREKAKYSIGILPAFAIILSLIVALNTFTVRVEAAKSYVINITDADGEDISGGGSITASVSGSTVIKAAEGATVKLSVSLNHEVESITITGNGSGDEIEVTETYPASTVSKGQVFTFTMPAEAVDVVVSPNPLALLPLAVYLQQGSGTATLVKTYTQSDLEELTQTTQYYTGIDSLPAVVQGKGTGVLLSTLIDDLKKSNNNVCFGSGAEFNLYCADVGDYSNGSYTYDYLEGVTRCYYPNLTYIDADSSPCTLNGSTDGAVTIEPMLCITSNQDRSLSSSIQTPDLVDAYTQDTEYSYRFVFGLAASEIAGYPRTQANVTHTVNLFAEWTNKITFILPDSYAVTADGAITGGTITTDVTSAAPGDTVTLTLTHDDGYHLKANTLAASYSDGTDTYTLSLTSTSDNTWTFIKPAYAVSVTAEFEANLDPPALTADSTNNIVNQPVDITFNDDANWRSAVTGVIVNGTSVSNYTLTAGQLTIPAGYFTTVKDYTIIVKATNYNNVTLVQTIQAGPTIYTVTFISDGEVYTTENAAEGSQIAAPTTPTKSGCTFDGWFTDTTYSSTAITFPYTVTANINLYAKWLNNYTVTFISDDEIYTTESAAEGSQIAAPTDPTKSGCTFDGWFTDTTYTSTAVAFPYTVTADINLYAKWLNNYTVTFISDNVTYTTESAAEGSQIAAPTTPTKNGCTFDGWFTDTTYSSTAVAFPYTVTADINLYAKWLNNYTVTFISDNSTYYSIAAASGSEIAAPANPTKNDYTFGGWYSDAYFNTRISFPYTVTADITLYAKWTANGASTGSYFAITINDVIGGTANITTKPSSTALEGSTVTISISIPNTDPGYNHQVKSVTVTGDGDVTVTEAEEGKTYTFTMPAEDVTIDVELEAVPLQVYAKTTSSGSSKLIKTYTQSELEDLSQTTQCYTAIDSMPALVQGIGTGVLLTDLVDDLQEYNPDISFTEGSTIKLTCADHYSVTFTYDYLMGETRYYYPNLTYLSDDKIKGNTDKAEAIDPMFAVTSYQSRSLSGSVITQSVLEEATTSTSESYRFCFGLLPSDVTDLNITANKLCKWVYRIDLVVADSETTSDTTYKVTIDNDITGGTVKTNKTNAAAGATVTLTVTPNPGQQLKTGTLVASYNDQTSTQTQTLTKVDNNTYTFIMPAFAVTVTAKFENISTTPIPTIMVTPASAGIITSTPPNLPPDNISEINSSPRIFPAPDNFSDSALNSFLSNNPSLSGYQNNSGNTGDNVTFDLSGWIDSTGLLTTDYKKELSGPDNHRYKIILEIAKNTLALTKEKTAIKTIDISSAYLSPAVNKNKVIIAAYDCGPDGSTFSIPITLGFQYDPDQLPAGISENALVIAYYDTHLGTLVTLASQVDLENHIVSARVSHFTELAIVASRSSGTFWWIWVVTIALAAGLCGLVFRLLRRRNIPLKTVPARLIAIIRHWKPVNASISYISKMRSKKQGNTPNQN